VLPVIVAAANDQSRLVPDDLRADGEARVFEDSSYGGGVQGAMPDVSDIAGEQCLGIPPVCTIALSILGARFRWRGL
jgi:hypothetical protein